MVNKSAINSVIFLFIAVSVFFIFRELSVSIELEKIEFNPVWHLLLLALLPQLFFYLFASVAWKSLLNEISEYKLDLLKSYVQISWVLVGKYIPGKVWGFLVRSTENKKDDISFEQSFYATYVEQLVSVYAGLSLAAILYTATYVSNYALLTVLLAQSILMLFPFMNHKLFNIYCKIFDKEKKYQNASGGNIKLSIPFYVKLYFIYILEWVSIGLILVCLVYSVFPLMEPKYIPYIIGVNALAYISGFFVLYAPGGLGVREATLVALLSSILGLTEAITISIIFRIWCVIFDLISGLLAFLLSIREKK